MKCVVVASKPLKPLLTVAKRHMIELTQDELNKIVWNPSKNDNVIAIIKQEDGNYKGFMKKNGKLVQVRQSDPNTVMQLLITAD